MRLVHHLGMLQYTSKWNTFIEVKLLEVVYFSPGKMWIELQYLFHLDKEKEMLGIQSSSLLRTGHNKKRQGSCLPQISNNYFQAYSLQRHILEHYLSTIAPPELTTFIPEDKRLKHSFSACLLCRKALLRFYCFMYSWLLLYSHTAIPRFLINKQVCLFILFYISLSLVRYLTDSSM